MRLVRCRRHHLGGTERKGEGIAFDRKHCVLFCRLRSKRIKPAIPPCQRRKRKRPTRERPREKVGRGCMERGRKWNEPSPGSSPTALGASRAPPLHQIVSFAYWGKLLFL